MSKSIRGRFLVVSVLSVVILLSLAGVVFIEIFSRSLERRLDDELTSHINNLAGALRISDTGAIRLSDRPLEARFNQPYGGLYWQVVDDQTGTELRSQSLWDYALPLPSEDHAVGEIHRYHLQGPEQTQLLVQERKVALAGADGLHPVRIAVGMDTAPIMSARHDFTLDMVPYMVILAAFLVGISLAQLTYGLRPLSTLNEGLNRIRERRAERLSGTYPDELTATVGAVNSLLDAQEAIISKARARAGDLAHGLKTPLTVLSNDAFTLQEKGETEIGDELAHLAKVMQAHVNRELTRSRIAASAGLRRSDANIAACVESVVRTLKRTPKGELLDWTISIPSSLTVPVDPHDLQELLGNILENAVKWTAASVIVKASVNDGEIVLVVSDDGPGADPAEIRRLMERGVRLDMQTPGDGIGLSIVREIADVYRIAVEIDNRDGAGLQVVLRFR